LRVAILTGAGDQAFCAGSDLRPQPSKVPRPATGFGGLTQRFDLDKPVIAAVNGVALGGGFELALACDIIIAAAGASFGLPEPRLGLAPLAGGPHRLARAIGDKRTLGLLLSARIIDAPEAHALGFVHRVVPDDELVDVAWRHAEEIAALSPAAVRACKQLVTRGLAEPSVEAAMRAQADYPAVKAMFALGDAKEGVRAFREKRAPQWRS
jgi:crotonobetainyl-CoA hydratase